MEVEVVVVEEEEEEEEEEVELRLRRRSRRQNKSYMNIIIFYILHQQSSYIHCICFTNLRNFHLL